MSDLVLALVAGLIGALAALPAYFVGRRNADIDAGFDVQHPARGDRSPHEHVWDTMWGDGKGWRCGVCFKVRG